MKRNRGFVTGLAVVLLLAGCVEETANNNETPTADSTATSDEGIAGSVAKFEGEIFSIPSPIQTAILFQKANIEFDADLLNSSANKDKYVNKFQGALNMGVYGTDLAYLSVYEKSQMGLDYFTAIEGLAGQLDISSNLDPTLFDRFTNNIDNRDSLYVLNAELYKQANSYLKDNEQNETASLILAGGWIEATHISLDAALENEGIRNRIGEQRSALRSLVQLLSTHDDSQVKQVHQGLSDMVGIYDNMESTYTFVKPITDEDARITYINSKSSVTVTDEMIAELKAKVGEIRGYIIN
jgi:hypothetical protein